MYNNTEERKSQMKKLKIGQRIKYRKKGEINYKIDVITSNEKVKYCDDYLYGLGESKNTCHGKMLSMWIWGNHIKNGSYEVELLDD